MKYNSMFNKITFELPLMHSALKDNYTLQKVIAQKMGITPQALNAWLKLRAKIPLKRYLQLVKVLEELNIKY